MRVLLLGDTALSHQVARIIGPELVGMVSEPGAWPSADLGVSAGYRHRVPQDVLDRLPIVNLHTGYLPYNRGAYPNVWPIVDGTPAGVTLHWMDAGIDTGDIIARERVPVLAHDTAHTLYLRLQKAAVELFRIWWLPVNPRILRAASRPQVGPWTEHRKQDLEAVTLRLGQTMPVERTLAILRARSFPGHRGVTFTQDGVTWEVTVNCRRVE